MSTNYWKRFSVYEGIVTAFFLLNIFLYILNEDYLSYAIPKEIAGYLFWLSLGLYLGFRLCRYEMFGVWKKIREDEQKEIDKNTETKLKIVKD